MGNIVLINVIDRLALGKTVMLALPLMLFGTLILITGVIWQDYMLLCLIVGMTLISFGEGCSFSVLYRFALSASEVSKGTVAAAVGMLMMVAFFVVIEVVRILYGYFDMWAYSVACFVLIALWFSVPRTMIKTIMQERLAKGQF